jgi:cytochrome d ubiquinol oxidase subunit II
MTTLPPLLVVIFIAIIAFGVFMYVLLDGFDLGLGILFPFATR